MYIFKTKRELSAFVNEAKEQGAIVGFVPTMGALHEGHLSLIQQSKKNSDITLASIFVNPTQFNNADDLKSYPRNVIRDVDLLEKEGCDAVFIPDEKEIYPEKDTRIFDFEGIDSLMEGEHRPGHFNGVAQVVSKLFDAVKPNKAFFGQKDFQQVAIIKMMVKKLNFDIEIIACPIIREYDGLAMSSRNQLLKPEYRQVASNINRILQLSALQVKTLRNANQIKSWIVNEFKNVPLLELEYFEVVDEETLKPVELIDTNTGIIACIAVWAGKVRLIDNIIYNY